MRRGHTRRGNSLHKVAAAGAGAIAIAMAVDATRGATRGANVTVQNTAVGVTPRYIGYNMGHYMPASNASAWLEYSGVNAFRFWAASNDYESTTGDDIPPYGDGVTTLGQFDARKAALRADPENPSYINWTQFNSRFETRVLSGRNKAVLNPTMRELQRLGVEPILQITRSNAYAYDGGWGGKWEQWQHYYAMGYHAAKNFDAQKLQMYNEPDLDDVGVAGWEERMRLASDAFKSAVEDVNRIYGKRLAPQVWAPVAADQDGTIDTWGKAALQNNRTDYAGRPQARDNFDVYDVHRYNTIDGYASDQVLFDNRIPLYNASGANMPVAYTEFNRYTSGTWSTRADSLDNDYNAAEWAAIFPGAMSQDVKAMIAFKFNQTEWTSSTTGAVEPQKTGFHFVSETGDRNTTGGTRASESMRLIAKAFKNERPRLGQTVSADATYAGAASIDHGKGNYHYLSVNRDTADDRAVTLNLSSWNILPNSVISVQEVSQRNLGGVPQFLTVPSNKIITFTQPKASTWLLTVPSSSIPQGQATLGAIADAEVSNATPLVNFGLAPTANVARSAADNNDQATYLKFNLGSNSKPSIARAFLHLTGSNVANGDTTILHVYGIKNDAWTETGINWGNAPDLAGAADARLANVGTDAFPVGQLVWDNTVNEWGIEITDFVRKHPDLDLSFVVIREERFAPGYAYDPDGDADTSRVQINTREAATGRPRMTLFTGKPHYYWNANPDSKTPVNFSAATSWDVGSAPNNGGVVAVIGDHLTASRTITMDAPAAVGELRFDNHNGQTISGNATLTFGGPGIAGMAINVYKGSHVIDTPVSLASSTTIGVGEGLALTISKPIAGHGALFKTGPGVVHLTAANTYDGSTHVSDGTLRLGASLTRSFLFAAENDAKVELVAGGDKVIKAAGLQITGTAQVDLTDNRLITSTDVGVTLGGGAYTGVTGMIQRAYQFGEWNQPGLTSSLASTTGGVTTLAVNNAAAIFGLGGSDTLTWSGQTITGTSTLVMYTYAGDLNLDGLVDGADYGVIDNYVQFPGTSGYGNGDFNFDGVIDGADYGIIDNSVQLQGAPFPSTFEFGAGAAASSSSLSAVPEPSASGFAILASAALLRRRRGRREKSLR